jgi:hypothetical protein
MKFARFGRANRCRRTGVWKTRRAVEGDDAIKMLAFRKALRELENRIKIFMNLPIKSLDKIKLQVQAGRNRQNHAGGQRMSAACEVNAKAMEGAQLGFFERYLTLWVALCIVTGIVLGHFLPGVFQAIGKLEIAQVNLPVALLIWLMIIPMLVKIDFAALREVGQYWRGIGVTLLINWGSSRSRWRCWAGCSSAGCSRRCCLRIRSNPTSPA